MFPIYTPWKHQKTFGFLVFLGGKNENIGQKCINSIVISYHYLHNGQYQICLHAR